jgi:hypothetical protein
MYNDVASGNTVVEPLVDLWHNCHRLGDNFRQLSACLLSEGVHPIRLWATLLCLASLYELSTYCGVRLTD